MTLSCLPVSYFKSFLDGTKTVDSFVDEARDLGLDAIDLSVLYIEPENHHANARLRHRVENAGMFVNMISSYTDFTCPDADVRRKQAGKLTTVIEMAAALGARMVRVTAGQAHPGVTHDQGIAWAVEGLTGSLSFARKHRVKLVFENHARPGAWEHFDFTYPTEIFLSTVRATAGTELGVNFDTANTLAFGDDPLPVLEAVIKRVVSIHAAETSARGVFAPAVLGTGAVPFRDIFRLLHRHGYDGSISIEEASNTGHAGLATAVEFVRRVWSEETVA